MSKIRLLILLLINLSLFSCVNSQKENLGKLSVAYIGNEYDGLVLSNQLKKYLNNFGMLDERSNLQIQADVSHSNKLFITNIDNTSDRERIDSKINLKVYDNELGCLTYLYTNNVSQYYVLAASDKFISNKSAVDEIKLENIEYLVKVFINNLNDSILICNEKK